MIDAKFLTELLTIMADGSEKAARSWWAGSRDEKCARMVAELEARAWAFRYALKLVADAQETTDYLQRAARKED